MHWARSKHLLYHWHDADNDDDYITCMAVINLQHQTGPEAWNRSISWLIWLIIGNLPVPRYTITRSIFWQRRRDRIFAFSRNVKQRRGNWLEGGQWQWAISGQFPTPAPRNTSLWTPPPPGIQRSRPSKMPKTKKSHKNWRKMTTVQKHARNWSKKGQSCPSCTSPSLWQGEIFACVIVDTDIWTDEVKILSYSGTNLQWLFSE